jgi:hypothetical protein
MAASKCLYSDQPPPTAVKWKKTEYRRVISLPEATSRQSFIYTAMFDAEKDRLHAINHRLDQLRGYL